MAILAPLTITAVNTAADQLTIAGHGLTTGAPFVGVYTPNGTLPAPLTGTDDYWAILVDANTIRLAASSALALAGTAIDLTSAGSGTLQLVRGLPYRRPRISAPGTQVFSADNNTTWESLVAIWNLLSGQAQSVFTGIKLAINQNIELSGTGIVKHGARTLTQAASAQGTYTITTPAAQFNGYGIRAGSRVTQAKILISKSTTGSTSLTVKQQNGATFTDRSSTSNTTVAGGQEIIINLTGGGYTLVDEDSLLVYVVPPAGVVADLVFSVTWIYDRP